MLRAEQVSSKMNNALAQSFQRDGYVVLRNVIDPQKYLDPLLAELSVRLDNLLDRLQDEGEIPPVDKGLPFNDRLIHLYSNTGGIHTQAFNISVPAKAGIAADMSIYTGEAVFWLLRHHAVLDAVEVPPALLCIFTLNC